MPGRLGRIDEFGNTGISDNEGEIRDILTGNWIRRTKSEQIRQECLKRIIRDYDYNPGNVKIDVPIGTSTAGIGGRADIVVFDGSGFDPAKNAYIVAVVGSRDRNDGADHIKKFMDLASFKFGIWFSGEEIAFYQRVEDVSGSIAGILDIPKSGESLEDVGNHYKTQLIPSSNLKSTFETIHNFIYANEGLLKEKVFNEMLNLIFVKLVDEKLPDPKCQFRITNKEMSQIERGESSEFIKRLESLFREAIREYPDVFGPRDMMTLKPLTLGFVVSQLQRYSLLRTPFDVKGTAFQTFVHARQRGDRGEYFTPKPILDLVVQFLRPTRNDVLIDPACGSGGFLVAAINYIRIGMRKDESDINETAVSEAVRKCAETCIHGIDFNPDLARVAKLNMILNGDGHTGIFCENSLESWDVLSESSMRAQNEPLRSGSFDIVMTNPPFGSKGRITAKRILCQFDLAHRWKKTGDFQFAKEEDLLKGQIPDILFIERCLELLKPHGRMAIVLPDGDLTNSSLEYVRSYIDTKSRIVAVVSLPMETFASSGAGIKASVLFLQKLPSKELDELKANGYRVFTAVINKVGYDIRGRTVFKRDDRGEVIKKEVDITDSRGTRQRRILPLIDTDVGLIVSEFEAFRKEEGLEW